MEPNNYIVHQGKIGVPDPAFPFPKLQPPDLHGEWKDDKYKKAFDSALLHTAWFADEEQDIAMELLPGEAHYGHEGELIKDGLYTVPDMPEWEKVNQTITFGGDWLSEGVYNPEYPNDSEHRTIVRFVKEKEDNAPITSGAHQGEGPRNPSTPPSFIPTVEKLHAKLMDAFHALRGIKGDNPEKTLTLNGIEFSEMIAMCKKSLYKEIL